MQAQPWRGDVQALEQLAQKFSELTTAAKQNKAEFGERESEQRIAKKKVKKIYGIPGNNTFLPYDKGYSEANERATRWAHRSDVKVGDWKLASYHQR